MKTARIKQCIVALLLTAGLTAAGHAENPVIQTKFTADPAPMVYKDTVYLYTGHDEDDAPEGMAGFKMKDWLLYTSTDMVNWTDRGAVATLKHFKWLPSKGWGSSENGAWAAQCIERDGKFYMYCPLLGRGIAVLVADNPLGPFTDPLGKALISDKFDSIDPTVFIDDDGQAYLYWGNPNVWYVKLNKDMISYSGEITKDKSFAKVKGQKDPYHYQEGPWVYKRDGRYYMAYASTCCPEGIGYAMSDAPLGPWEFKGYIMKPNKNSSGNHPGIIDYKGKTYVFGFNYRLNFMQTPKHHERRSVCVDEIKYNADGTIQEVPWWKEEGVAQVGTLNPYTKTEAETICWSSGVKTEVCSAGGMDVCNIQNGSYIKIKGVDFAKGAKSFKASVASDTKGGKIEIYLDNLTTGTVVGTLVGTLDVPSTGGAQEWKEKSCKIKDAKGVHDLYFKFVGKDGLLFNFDWWKFE
jgi:arabinoxylan arabinofuranohydrolase